MAILRSHDTPSCSSHSFKKSFQEIFENFLKNHDSKIFLQELQHLSKDEKEINRLTLFDKQLLTPLSIIIRIAFLIERPLIILQMLIDLGSELNVDYGYHGDRHPDRPSPPLIEAIQLSLQDSKKNIYSEICYLLIANGASINKIADNITPLCAAYNPHIEEVFRIGAEIPELCPEKIERFHHQKRNSIIFNELLSHQDINVMEYDIIPRVKIFWQIIDSKEDNEKWKRSFGFQLLNIMDYQLKKFPNPFIEEKFFKPLFEKYLEQSSKASAKLKKITRERCTQEFLDAAEEKGELFSTVTRHYGSQLPELADLIRENRQFHVEDMVISFLNGQPKALQSLAGIYPVPTQYFGSRDKVSLQGFIYHLDDVIPLLHAKSDCTSVKRMVKCRNQSVPTYSFEDFTYKIHHYTPREMFVKSIEANERRLRKIPETRDRKQLMRSGGITPDEDAKYPTLLNGFKKKKEGYKKYHTMFFNFSCYELQELPSSRTLAGVYHDELLCLYLGKPRAILTVTKVHETRERGPLEKKPLWVDVIHDELIHLRSLQTQRHYYYLTGEYIPITTTRSSVNKPVIVNRSDLECLRNIFMQEQEQRKYGEFLQRHSNFPVEIVDTLIDFYGKGIEKNLDLLLLWSIQMGFISTTFYLLNKGVQINVELADHLNILDVVLKKNYLDEANLLLAYGLKPKEDRLLQVIAKKFPRVFLNNSMDDKIQSQEIILLNLLKRKINFPYPLNRSSEKKSVNFSYHPLTSFRLYWKKTKKLFLKEQLFKCLADDIFEVPYVDQPHDFLFFRNKRIFHPNHGTTHGIRQAVYLRNYLEVVTQEGAALWRSLAKNISEEELACIELCAFLYRSGRTNEKRWSEDGTSGPRSAAIFQCIATELGFDGQLVKAIADNCFSYQKEINLSSSFLKNNVEQSRLKIILFEKLLKLSHEVDLVRCTKKINTPGGPAYKIEKDLFFLLGKEDLAKFMTITFLKFASTLCAQTGAHVIPADLQAYSGGSVQGDTALAIRSALEADKTTRDLSFAKLPTEKGRPLRSKI